MELILPMGDCFPSPIYITLKYNMDITTVGRLNSGLPEADLAIYPFLFGGGPDGVNMRIVG